VDLDVCLVHPSVQRCFPFTRMGHGLLTPRMNCRYKTVPAGVNALQRIALLAATAVLALAGTAHAAQHPLARPHGPAPFGRFSKTLCPQPKHRLDATCFARVLTTGPGAAPALTSSTPAGYGPVDLQTAYGLPALSSTRAVGQTVALVDAFDDPTAEADLNVYRAAYGLSTCTTANGCFRKVNEFGGTSYPAVDLNWAGEISLDLDMVSAIAPNAHILLVEASSASFADFGTSVDTAAALGATQISNSYGTQGLLSSQESSLAPYDAHYNHPGIAVVASAGDHGWDDWEKGGTAPPFPASSEFVQSVGGTSLTSTAPRVESVWNSSPNPGAGGSGCSSFFPRRSFDVTPCLNRSTADVAADADPATGVSIYDSNSNIGGWAIAGGTSAAAPMIAGVDALVGPSAGSPQFPYLNPSAWNDVTAGTNGSCGAWACTAGPGFDGPTGLGTPKGSAFLSPSAPTASIASPADSAAYPQGQVILARYSCAEGGSGPGLKSCVGPVPNGATIDTSTPGLHTFTVVATSTDSLTASASATYMVVPPPTVSITTPANNAAYTQGQIVNASYTCLEGAFGPGMVFCGGPVASGAPIDTSTPGNHSFTVAAASADGLNSNMTVTYTVQARVRPPAPRIPVITQEPPRSTRNRNAVFKFRDSTPRATFRCRLDKGKWARCNSPKRYWALHRGTHTFYVRAINAGGFSRTATFTWRIR
jgi:Subtilase family